MTILTSKKELPATKIVDSSSVCLGPDALYHQEAPPYVDLHAYREQRRHNQAWIKRWLLHWCGRAILMASVAVMLFALLVLLLSWAEGYPTSPRVAIAQDENAPFLHLQRMGNRERQENEYDPSNGRPVVQMTPFDNNNGSSSGSSEEESGVGMVGSLDSVFRAMRRRMHLALHSMRQMFNNAPDEVPSFDDKHSEIVGRINIDGVEFVQTRQVLRKALPEGQGTILIVRQHLLPVDEFFKNGTTTTRAPEVQKGNGIDEMIKEP